MNSNIIPGVGKIAVGDRIIFKSPTRDDYRRATRQVVGFDSLGRPLVVYKGWSDFVVFPSEVISVIKAEGGAA